MIPTSTEVQYPARKLADLLYRVLQPHLTELRGAGQPSPDSVDAELAVRWLVETEILGLGNFGVHMFVRELERIQGLRAERLTVVTGASQATVPPTSVAAIDAATMPGQLALALASRTATARADENGISAVGIHNAGALGVLGCAARSIAKQGRIGLIVTNSPPSVAPWGGSRAAIGTNPIALAVPRVGLPPLVLDYATSPMTIAALRRARETGSALPGPGGFDGAGTATTDPRLVSVIAPTDRIASLTGLAVEMLVGVGVGHGPSTSVVPGTRSALVVALQPEAFGNTDAAELGAALARSWTESGGHTPQRFDVLPDAAENALNSLNMTQELLDALTSYIPPTEAGEKGPVEDA